jgi:DNA repair photolyase
MEAAEVSLCRRITGGAAGGADRRTCRGGRWRTAAAVVSGLRLLSPTERAGLEPRLAEPIEYRKSGLSLNHVAGCPLQCAYCIRHEYGGYGLKVPRLLMSDEQAVAELVGHRLFVPDVTPLQLLNRATDPMLPAVKPHTLAVARLLDARGLRNHLLIITRWRIEPEDCAALNELQSLRVTVLVTHSNITDERIEPVDSGIARESLRTAFAAARRYRVVLYWRPLVPGLNDSQADLALAAELSRSAHATVFTGLFFRAQIRAYYRRLGLPEPYAEPARRKILPAELDRRVVDFFARHAGGAALFRKTSCAVAHAHGLPDFNGHFGIRELCDICPSVQQRRCGAGFRRPDVDEVAAVAAGLGATSPPVVTERAVITAGLDEQARYFLQHRLRYQVHDAALPHQVGRHGRADTGWPAEPADGVHDRVGPGG